MTQQYIIGQFSASLGDLQPVTSECLAVAIHDLRHEVESAPVAMLPELARQAMDLTDAVCWEALESGDTNSFCRYVKGASALREVTDCAELLIE